VVQRKFDSKVPREGVPKVFTTGWWRMAKSQETAILNFAGRVRGFSLTECSAFLCAFAPLREYISFRESVSATRRYFRQDNTVIGS